MTTGRTFLQGIDYEKSLQDRRRALEGKRFSVQFYGGWFMIDNRTNATVSHNTFEQAIDGAEAANKDMPTNTLHGLSYCSA